MGLSKESMAYKNKMEYIKKFNKQHRIQKNIYFNKDNDEDMEILNHIQVNKLAFGTYVKYLIKKDMQKDWSFCFLYQVIPC